MHENLDRMNLKAYISCLIFSHFQQISTTNSDAQEVYQCYYIKIVIIYIFISGNHFISEGTKITPDDKGGGTTREKFRAQSISPFLPPSPFPFPFIKQMIVKMVPSQDAGAYPGLSDRPALRCLLHSHRPKRWTFP